MIFRTSKNAASNADQSSALSTLPCEDLLRLCTKQGCEDAWSEFMRRYHRVIAGSVARITRQYGMDELGTIEEIVQEVYLKLCDGDRHILREFRADSEDGIFSFLKVVSSNVARDRCDAVSTAKRGGGNVISLSHADHPVSAEEEFSNRLARQLFLEKVETILLKHTNDATAARDRSVFWLYYRQGFTAREIAAIPAFGLTAKGVESLLQRLVRQIRSELVSGYEGLTEGFQGPGPFYDRG